MKVPRLLSFNIDMFPRLEVHILLGLSGFMNVSWRTVKIKLTKCSWKSLIRIKIYLKC